MSRYKSLNNEPVELLIESMAHDGRGVGRHNGKAVFIDGALPGETVRAQLKQRRRKFDIAQLQQVLTVSPDRVEAKCRHYDQCGGCSLQHMDSQAQLRSKQTLLAESLNRIGKVQPQSWLQPLQADIWGYRGKARLGVRYVEKKQRVLVGFREKGSAFITDTSRCEILVPSLGAHLQQIADALLDISIRDAIPQIEVAADDRQLCLNFRVLQPLADGDKDRLIKLAKALECEILLQPEGPDSIYPLTKLENELSYTLPEWNVTIVFRPQDFTQVNSSLNRKMVAQALRLLEPEQNETVLDLFCGLGNFSLPIATVVNKVIGVEGDSAMVKQAHENASRNQLQNVEFYTADLFQPVANEHWRQQKIDKVLLDPPRSGAEEISKWLIQKGPGIIVYVSCNPSTLARDASILVNSGSYILEKAGVMDMFPHTAHTEAMAVFRKKA
ncbi:MAG: 23S rRNA (uracil(1939)-C(5))-methyltransferase RlmD [Gammaproteobacteria bacterium]|nr:23S rRNA (uracil(1939)-C(5))-methyltransferase RlmD [Gammaproteobacteria bacterium]